MKKSIFVSILTMSSFFVLSAFAQDTWVINNLITTASTTWSTGNSMSLGNSVADYDVEFKEALAWMYLNWLTSFWDPSSYRPFDSITREEASKVIWRFAKKILTKSQVSWLDEKTCLFADSSTFSSYLAEDVYQSCLLGIFKWWSDSKFYASSPLTKAQGLVVLVRMFDDKSYSEDVTPWFRNYYDRAYQLWLVQDKNLSNFERAVTRYEIALMIYRFNIKFKLFKEAVIKDKDELMTFIDDTLTSQATTWANGQPVLASKWQVLIDTTLLTDPSVDRLTINTTDAKYVVRKRELNTYWSSSNNYVRYGDLYNEQDTELIWVTTFAVINWYVSEAYIRPTELWNKYYEITPSTQPPYFDIAEKFVNQVD